MVTRHFLRAGAIAVGTSLITACSGGALNQGIPSAGQPQSPSIVQGQQAHPIDVEQPYTGSLINTLQPGALKTWNGSFTYKGVQYSYTMVGTNPASNNSTTTIPVTVIPLRMEFGKTIFTPYKKLPNGRTILENILLSPLFQNNVNFVQGGVDLGKTQYIDAFQRGNFWSSVSKNSRYNVVLHPTVASGPIDTIQVPPAEGHVAMEFGIEVGLVLQSFMDSHMQGIISAMGIPPSTLALFVTRDVYMGTTASCCSGGFHQFNGTNTYATATYVDHPGVFAQDVSAFSHELGEWYDDPYVNNHVKCGYLEVGDPEEGLTNFLGYPYKVNGFTYNLVDLVFLPYFGAPSSMSVNSWFTFQDIPLTVCEYGG